MNPSGKKKSAGYFFWGAVLMLCPIIGSATGSGSLPSWLDGRTIQTYRKNDQGTKWLCMENESNVLEIKSPGTGIHDGVTITIPKIESDTIYTISAAVRGEGRVLMADMTDNGWTYSKTGGISLSKSWENIVLSKVTGKDHGDMRFCLITPPGKICPMNVEIKDLKIESRAVPLPDHPDEITVKYPIGIFLAEEKRTGETVSRSYKNIPVPQINQPLFISTDLPAQGVGSVRIRSSRIDDRQEMKLDATNRAWSAVELGETMTLIVDSPVSAQPLTSQTLVISSDRAMSEDKRRDLTPEMVP